MEACLLQIQKLHVSGRISDDLRDEYKDRLFESNADDNIFDVVPESQQESDNVDTPTLIFI